ncbi:MAG TPA: hypothetical protein VIE88_18630, partial [Vicinamibacteria bacterium]
MSQPARRRLFPRSFALVILAISASIPSSSLAQQEQKRSESPSTQEGRVQFRSRVEAVNLSVVVTDKKGRFVPDLKVENFVVYENSVPQEVAFFTAEV